VCVCVLALGMCSDTVNVGSIPEYARRAHNAPSDGFVAEGPGLGRGLVVLGIQSCDPPTPVSVTTAVLQPSGQDVHSGFWFALELLSNP